MTGPAQRNLIGDDLSELGQMFEGLGVSPGKSAMRARQLWHWIYHQGETNFAEMTTLGKELRGALAEGFSIRRPEIVTAQVSEDGTRKWLLRFDDGQEVETVFIPEEDRGALCVSSQVGCTLTCKFCHTGTQRLVRNLTAGEIMAQVLVARDALGEWPSGVEGRLFTNIVMMGMGEPLYNFDNVKKAVLMINHPEGLSISRRRITLSTSGVVPMMERCGAEIGVNLAVSLHAVRDDLRDMLMPLNKKYPLADLLEACRNYPGARNANRITFEYVMLKDLNDSLDDARAMVKLLQGIPAKINLIPFNPWPGVEYECSSGNQIRRFSEVLNKAGLSAPIRRSRGQDIMAACGQLKSESIRLRKSERQAATAAE